MTKSISTAAAALLLIVFVALACSEDTGESPAAENTEKSENTAAERSSNEPVTVDLDLVEEEPEEEEMAEETPEPTPAAPERVRFGKGESQGRITIALGPGESKKYVVGVAPAQYFHVGIDDDTPVIKLLSSSMLRDSEKGDTFLDGMTTRSGDILIEFSNPTTRTVRTFALVTIKFPDQMD